MQSALTNTDSSQIEKGIAFGQYEYVNVKFGSAHQDTPIKTQVLKNVGPAFIHWIDCADKPVMGPQVVPYDTANFGGVGDMTWVPPSIGGNGYSIQDDMMTLWLVTSNADVVGGTLGNALEYRIPNNYTAAALVYGTFGYIDNGTRGIGFWRVLEGASIVEFFKPDVSNWQSSSTTSVRMSGVFPIQGGQTPGAGGRIYKGSANDSTLLLRSTSPFYETRLLLFTERNA